MSSRLTNCFRIAVNGMHAGELSLLGALGGGIGGAFGGLVSGALAGSLVALR